MPPIPEAVTKTRYMRVGSAKFSGRSATAFDTKYADKRYEPEDRSFAITAFSVGSGKKHNGYMWHLEQIWRSIYFYFS